MNGVLTRNEVVIEMAGDNGVAHVAGAALGDGDFHHDDTVFVTHDAVGCESRQVFKKVLRNGATGVFQGKILVKPGAQKTDGYQISQALLLDEDSQFLAKPELEIYADDVACSHGSTTGAIDETALFYLRSRGVPLNDAQDLLVLAFLAEAIDEIEDEASPTRSSRGWKAGWRGARLIHERHARYRAHLSGAARGHAARCWPWGQREDRALVYLMLACFLIFVAQWPRLSRQALLGPVDAARGAAGRGAVWLGVHDAAAALRIWRRSAIWSRALFGGRGTFYGRGWRCSGRFWRPPRCAVAGLVAGFIGPGPALTLAGVGCCWRFVLFWGASLWEAERRRRQRHDA